MSLPARTVARKSARVYHSPRRQARARHTRQRILAAASTSFLTAGYAATTMRGVASAARVAVQTVELAFRTKPQLLKAVIDVAIVGDDQPIPVLQRDWALATQSTPDVAEFIASVGYVVGVVLARVAGLLVVVDEAAAADPEIAAVARQLDAQRATTADWIVAGIVQRAPLRADLSYADAVDTLWLLMDPCVFRRLMRERGWTAQRYESWFTASLQRLLLG